MLIIPNPSNVSSQLQQKISSISPQLSSLLVLMNNESNFQQNINDNQNQGEENEINNPSVTQITSNSPNGGLPSRNKRPQSCIIDEQIARDEREEISPLVNQNTITSNPSARNKIRKIFLPNDD